MLKNPTKTSAACHFLFLGEKIRIFAFLFTSHRTRTSKSSVRGHNHDARIMRNDGQTFWSAEKSLCLTGHARPCIYNPNKLMLAKYTKTELLPK